MRPPGTRPIILGFILAIGITLTLPHFAFGASRSFGSSGRFRGSTIQRQHFFSKPFNRFGLVPFNTFGVGGVVDDQQPVIIIQQFQPAPNPEPREPATNRIYVQPRWVDGGHGVEVLQPGYWTEAK
jgi:hypothetical protein